MTKFLTLLALVILTNSYAFAGKVEKVNCTFKVATLYKNRTVRVPGAKYYSLLMKVTINEETDIVEDVKYLTGQTVPGVGTTYAYPPFDFPRVTKAEYLQVHFGSLNAEESMKLLELNGIYDYPTLYRGFNIGLMTKDKNAQSVSVIEMLTSYDDLTYELTSHCEFY